MLTDNQRVFAQALVNGLSQVEAYKSAYNTKTDNYNSLSSQASKEANKPHVKAEIERLKNVREQVQNVAETRDKAYKINYIWERIEECKKNGDYSNVARFMDILNRMEAHYTDATQKDDTKPLSALSDDELKKLLETPVQ